MTEIQLCCRKGGGRLYRERFMHCSLHFGIVPEMKPMPHFMPVCRVALYQSLLALISVEVGSVPDYG